MKAPDLKTLRIGIALLVLTGISLSYIQVVTMEQWDKFCNFRIRLSRSVYFSSGQFERDDTRSKKTTPNMQLIYFEYNMTEADDTSTADDYEDPEETNIYDITNEKGGNQTSDELFIQKSDKANKSVVSQNEIGNQVLNKKRNNYSVLDLELEIQNETDFSVKPLMILFSSWAYSPEKLKVHETIRRLWNAWPSIKPLVMTKDHLVQNDCRQSGWMVQTLTNIDPACHGPPVLSTMFTDILKKHDAYFYGYSNADIIFGDGLEKTMKFLFHHFAQWKTKPVMVVGRRHNVDFIKHENFTLQEPDDVRRMTKYGKLVIRSTDYFFTNRHFPWGQAPKVTVGRPFVVRAIIGWALKRDY